MVLVHFDILLKVRSELGRRGGGGAPDDFRLDSLAGDRV